VNWSVAVVWGAGERCAAISTVTIVTSRDWDRIGSLPTMATHDTALGLAAQAFGFDVRGI